MPSRKVQALNVIGKITQQALEEKAAALGVLYRRIDALDAEKLRLREDLQSQAESRTLETAPFLPGYLRAVRAEAARIDAEANDLRTEIEKMEAALRERFREKKTFEKVLQDTREAEQAEEQRTEALVLDEFNTIRRGRAIARAPASGQALTPPPNARRSPLE